MYSIEKIRREFPFLNNDYIYLDNAATSLKPNSVIEAEKEYYLKKNINVGKGVSSLVREVSSEFQGCRENIARFIHCDPSGLIFTKNATEGLNLVAQGLGLRKGDKVTITVLEHHANFLPWLRLKRKGVGLDILETNKIGEINLSDVEKSCKGSRVLSITGMSNVTGYSPPLKEISKICRECGCLLSVDGAQLAPHKEVNVKKMGFDFFSFSSHKMLGPTGAGCVYIRPDLDLEPLIVGGGSISDVGKEYFELVGSPEKYESGTLPIAQVFGFSEAVNFLKGLGMDNIESHEKKLSHFILGELRGMDNVKVYSYKDTGIISFNVNGMEHHHVAMAMDKASKIIMRSGHHCAKPLMDHLGVDGTVRASFYLYNTMKEAERFTETLKKLCEM